jgi:hypothetical protein
MQCGFEIRQEPEYEFVLESTPNKFGVHDNGTIKIFVSSFNFGKEEINIDKIIKVINHETYHYAMRKALSEEELTWANQERIIGKIELKSNE